MYVCARRSTAAPPSRKCPSWKVRESDASALKLARYLSAQSWCELDTDLHLGLLISTCTVLKGMLYCSHVGRAVVGRHQ